MNTQPNPTIPPNKSIWTTTNIVGSFVLSLAVLSWCAYQEKDKSNKRIENNSEQLRKESKPLTWHNIPECSKFFTLTPDAPEKDKAKQSINDALSRNASKDKVALLCVESYNEYLRLSK